MQEGKFPKIEEYETPETKEGVERNLPEIVRVAVDYYFTERARILESYKKNSGDYAGAQEDIEVPDKNRVCQNLLEQITKGQHLEVVAFFDLIVSDQEEKLEILGAKPAENRDFGWRREEAKIRGARDSYAYFRDRFLDEIPALGKEYSKDDFEKWLQVLLPQYEDGINKAIKEGEEELKEYREKGYRIIDGVLAGRTITELDAKMLTAILNGDLKVNRTLAEEELMEFFLGNRYDREKLIFFEKEIMRFRQFKVQVESGEWVKIRSAI